jgi:predicted ribosome quality control (RQC) complex YloA/Tae2 family protein
MKYFYTLLVFFSAALVCFSQTPQRFGEVCVKDTCPYTEMAGSVIKCGKAAPEEVQSNGRFRLPSFKPAPKHPIGLTIEPKAAYKSYKIINTFEVDHIYVNVYDTVPIRIKMCDESELDVLRMNLANIKIGNIEKEYKDEIKQLKDEIKQLENRIKQLEKNEKNNKSLTEQIEKRENEIEKLKTKLIEWQRYANENANKLAIAEIEIQMYKNNPVSLIEKIDEEKVIEMQKYALEGNYNGVRANMDDLRIRQ